MHPLDPYIIITIENPQSGERKQLRYQIGRDQAIELQVGPHPPEFDTWGARDWRWRAERAEAFAKYIANDLAHRLLEAFRDHVK